MPASPEFRVEPAATPGGQAVLHVTGDIDGNAKASLPQAYAEAVGTGHPGSVLLDFAEVGYINSTGIAVIVGVLAQARAARLPISASGLTEHYRHIFTITRLVDFIQLIDVAPTPA